MKGLLVSVFRDASGVDCTNGGLSSKRDAFVLVKNGLELGPFEPRADRDPAIFLAKWYGRVIACPDNLEVAAPPRLRNETAGSSISHLNGWMFGGNFIYSSDSRFAALVPGSYPIPVYDRREF